MTGAGGKGGTEHAVVAGTGLTGTAVAFGAELSAAVFSLRWMALAVAVLVVADFGFGIADSVVRRGEEFHFSRAGRRTMGKLLEYYFYLAGGFLLGKALFEPLDVCTATVSAAVAFSLAALFEVDSILEHAMRLHGVEARFSVKSFFVRIIKKKLGIPEGKDGKGGGGGKE